MTARCLCASMIAALCCLAAVPSDGGEAVTASLTSTVRDASGGVLPGVAVSATGRETGATFTAFSDGEGRYAFDDLTPGAYDVAFELAGFDGGEPSSVVLRAGEPVALHQIIDVATLQETVTVTASAPREPIPVVPPPPRVLADIEPVTLHASICGPRQATGVEAPPVAVIAAVEREPERLVIGDRDVIVLDRGAADGVQVGANFVVRRRFPVTSATSRGRDRIVAEHTAALIQVVEATDRAAVARSVYVCDEVLVGDRIEPFDPQPRLVPAAAGTPDFSEPAHVLFAAHGRSVAAPAEFLVISRGADHGAHPGQWVTMFRRDLADGAVAALGRALVVAVQATSATIRIENARDAIAVGDSAALHR